MFWVGLLAVLAYVLWMHPPGWGSIGYGEDLYGVELSRQLMADSLLSHGKPVFHTDRMMAPFGISAAFYSWALERDWIGAIFWNWNPRFPWSWFYFASSMLGIYFGVGLILRRGVLSAPVAWGFALLVTLVNIPRHFKAFHHFEHLIHHWYVIGIFLDVWLLHFLIREKKWSFSHEVWRLLVLQLVLNLGGYYWGPSLIGWGIVRCVLVAVAYDERKSVSLQWNWKRALLPACLMGILTLFQAQWFLPLVKEISSFGTIFQPLILRGTLPLVVIPFWMDWFTRLFANWSAVNSTETVVTIGWIFLVPIFLGTRLTWRGRMQSKALRETLLCLLPFLFFMSILVLYGLGWGSRFVQKMIPTMDFFRVASRTGLFVPAVAAACLVLLVPVLAKWFEENRERRRVFFRIFLISSLAEVALLLLPFQKMPEMPAQLQTLLGEVKALPEDAVLDLPFCVTGGNGTCTGEFCPNFPYSNSAQALTGWHFKAVHGVYQARLTTDQCSYNRAPYESWFKAWRENRCFNDQDWKSLCDYLQTQKISAVLLYPDIWSGSRDPKCLEDIQRHLGEPFQKASLPLTVTIRVADAKSTEVWAYRGACVASKPARDH